MDQILMLWDLAVQAGPFGVVACLIAIWWLVGQHNSSRAGYVERIQALEAECRGLQEARLSDYRKLTEVVSANASAQVASAAAMSERSRSSMELTEAVKELLIHVKFVLQQGSRTGGA